MRRSVLLVGLWIVTAGLVVSFVLLAGPCLISDYYIARLGTPSPATDAAMLKLKGLGKWAVPSLLATIDERDATLTKMREGKYVDDSKFGWDTSIVDYYNRRRESPVECQADLCVYLLVSAWNSGWLTEAEQRRVLRCLQYGAIQLGGLTNAFPVDGPDIRIRTHHRNNLLAGGHESLWIQRKIELATRDASGERIIPWTGDSKRPMSWDIVSAGKPDPNLSLAQQCLNVRGVPPVEISVKPADLGIGRHAIYVRVSVGPTSKTQYNQSEEPPWYEQFNYGPIELQVTASETSDPAKATGPRP